MEGAQLADRGLLDEKQWSSGIFACLSDADSCCLSCWCPCIQFGQNQERAFRSQHRTCCRWSLLWMTPLLVVWCLSRLIEMGTGTQECKIVCHDGMHGLHEIDASVDLSGIDVKKDCFKVCPFVYPMWVEIAEPFAWVGACIVVAVMAGRRRALLRAQHRIRGSLESDVVCHCFCGCCSLAQEARQIAAEELLARQGEQDGVPASHAPQPMQLAAGLPATATATTAQPVYGYEADAAAVPALAQPIAQPVYSYEPKE